MWQIIPLMRIGVQVADASSSCSLEVEDSARAFVPILLANFVGQPILLLPIFSI